MQKHKTLVLLVIVFLMIGFAQEKDTSAQSNDANEIVRPIDTVVEAESEEWVDEHAPSATFTVTYIATDVQDSNPGNGVCETAFGCTLRAAIEEANATTAHDTINFNIPGTGPHIVEIAGAGNIGLPMITRPVTINGLSESPASCPSGLVPADLRVVLDGDNFGGIQYGLRLNENADGSIIKGVVITNFTMAGILIEGGDSIEIECNHIGIAADGTTAAGNGIGVDIQGEAYNNVVGGTTSTARTQRNVISGNDDSGIFQNNLVTNTEISGNYIGTDASGATAVGNKYGIWTRGTSHFIGGVQVYEGNVVSGNSSSGIRVGVLSDELTIGNNLIGTDTLGLGAVGNGANGIVIDTTDTPNPAAPPEDVYIGSVGTNRIAYNGEDGIMFRPDDGAGDSKRVSMRVNKIYANGQRGIDLNNDGVTINDSPDNDLGPNDLLNHPILTLAEQSGRITGTFIGPSGPAQIFTVDVYQNDSCDSSGWGEGQQYLDQFTVSSGGNLAFFDLVISPNPTVGKYLTLLATDPSGNTSEFGNCLQVTESIFVVDTTTSTDDALTGDGKCDVSGSSSDCSLRAAVQEVNALSGGPYKIYFDLPVASIIRPTSSNIIPTITTPVIIDAVTNNGAAACPNNKFVTIQGNLQGAPTVDGLVLGAGSDGSTIRGLAITRFTNGDAIQVDSSNNKILCNNLGVEADGVTGNANNIGLRVLGDNNVIGGATAVDRNLVSANSSVGIYLQPSADNNDIFGNYIGLDATGDADLGNHSTGLQIDGFNNEVGSAAAGSGNVITANAGNGIFLRETGGNNTIAGNIIGLNKNGSLSAVAVSGNNNMGIYVASDDNVIGGSSAAHRNLISNNGGHGIQIVAADSTQIKANYIGTDITGFNPIGNVLTGIRIEQGDDSVIGGDTAVEGNLIAANQTTGIILIEGVANTTIKNNIIGLDPQGFGWGNSFNGIHLDTNTSQTVVQDNLIAGNGRDGIRIDATAVLNDIYRNSISGNGWLGIDVNENGANNPAVPVSISSYDIASNKIEATLNGDPNTTYRVDFFSSSNCDSSGFGEGETYLNSLNITTNGAGTGSDMVTGAAFANGDYLTATATDTFPANETSEFSACELVNVCDTSNPLVPLIAIVNGGNDIQLNWMPDPTAQLYLIYRGVNTPYDLGTGYTSTNSVPWIDGDNNEVGDVAENHYYGIVVRRDCGDSVFSKTIGEFDFAIAAGTP
ncbi:MAG: right-handed parallel beta-helix repeat-containing protein [Anaerolineales bacterium]|nr:right-handed parallel beta-helix repeat-containing protein [Anaerolineales bacterium]